MPKEAHSPLEDPKVAISRAFPIRTASFAMLLFVSISISFAYLSFGSEIWYDILSITVFSLYIVYATYTYLEAIASARHVPKLDSLKDYPKMTIIVPCYNEAKVLARTIHKVANMDYPRERLRIIYVYDESNDGTRDVLEGMQNEFGFEIVENTSGEKSKAWALNHVLRMLSEERLKRPDACEEMIGIYDADHEPARDAAKRAAAWLVGDRTIGCVQGRCRIRNRDDNRLTKMIGTEFDAVYRVSHHGRPSLGGLGLFCGSNGYFRISALESVGYFESELVEDIDMGMKLQEAGWRVAYDPFIESWEDAPTTWTALVHQRKRWARGWLNLASKHIPRILRSENLSLSQKFNGAFILIGGYVTLVLSFAWVVLLLAFYAGLGFPNSCLTNIYTTMYCMLAPIATYSLPAAYDWHSARTRVRRYDGMSAHSPAYYLPYALLSVVFFMFLWVVEWMAVTEKLVLLEAPKWVKTAR